MVFYKEYTKLNTAYSRYLMLKRIFLSNFLRLKFPYKLTFALTYRCNLRCKTCFIWKKELKDRLTLNEIEAFFRKSNRFSWIDLTGGEIFLRNDLLDIVEIIFRYSRFLSILHFPTNGQLTEKIINITKKIQRFKRNINLVITVSMDGPQELNDEIRGKKGGWLNSLNTFIELRKLGFKFVYLGYTLSKYNSSSTLQDMLLSVKRFYPDIDYNDIHINIAHTSEHYFNNASLQLMPDDFSTKNIDKFLKRGNGIIKNFLEQRYLRLIPNYVSSKQIPLRCQALASTCFIDPYGDIYPCSLYDRRICNIKDIDYDLYKFWNEDRVQSIRKEILNKRCKGCWTPCEAYPAILGSILKS